MMSFTSSAFLKRAFSISMALSLCYGNAFGLSHSSMRNTSVIDPTPQQDEFVVSQAILLDGKQQPLCVANLAGRGDLTPRFAAPTGQDFESSAPVNLRACDENELEVIRLTSAHAAEKVQTAALPAVVLAGLAICEMTGLVGTVLGGATAAGLFTATGNVPGTIVGTLEGFVRLAGKTRLIRYSVGGPIGFICGSLGDLAGSTGVFYLLEKAKQTGLIHQK